MSEVTVVDILTNDERYEKYPKSEYRAFLQRLANGHWLMRVGLEDWNEKNLLYYELDGPPEHDEFGRITLLAPPLRVMLRRMWRDHRTSIPEFLFLYVRGYVKRAYFSSRAWKARVLLWDARLTLLRIRVSKRLRSIRSYDRG
jgi:hypothetical protein